MTESDLVKIGTAMAKRLTGTQFTDHDCRPWDKTEEDARLLFKGRSLGGMTPPFEVHLEQLQDPQEWVHSSVVLWRIAAMKDALPTDRELGQQWFDLFKDSP